MARSPSQIPFPLVVDTPEALAALPSQRRGRPLLLRLPGLTPAENEAWRLRLQAEFADCGCRTGSAFLLAGMAAYAVWLGWRIVGPAAVGPLEALRAVLVFFACAGAGKAVGKLLASRRLGILVRQLSAALPAPSYVVPTEEVHHAVY
ncbi:MAG TPA: hypothetical protein VHG28_06745 [Longimicrobiaceae bacterium]|nr:hypothetical protein [Longimicrobiaceae bacterium]